MKLSIVRKNNTFQIMTSSRHYLSINCTPMSDKTRVYFKGESDVIFTDRYGCEKPLSFSTKEGAETFIRNAPKIPESRPIKGWVDFLVCALTLTVSVGLFVVLS